MWAPDLVQVRYGGLLGGSWKGKDSASHLD